MNLQTKLSSRNKEMKKILIVDDNQNNRILIQSLVESYCEDNNETVVINEATNGEEAVAMAKQIHYSLIFMDIMMPVMDGVEATFKIHAFDSKVMIVAVSAIDDWEHQRRILTAGAEDYISKPINSDVFTNRLVNYFSLIQSRLHTRKKFNNDAANICSPDIFSRKLLFYIQNEDDISEFWEYYLMNQETGNEMLSACVRTLYALETISIKLGVKNQIIVEESDQYIYMTMTEVGQIDAKIIKLIFLKNRDVKDYKIDGNKLTIRVAKVAKLFVEPKSQISVTPPTVSTAVEKPLQKKVPYIPVTEILNVYDYMDEDDLEEIENSVGKLNSLMLMLSSSIEPDEVEEISYHLSQISKVTSNYNESYAISQSVASLSATIERKKDLFIQISKDMASICSAFGRDLSSWLRLIFVDGAPSVKYMDDTIIANVQTIESMLLMDENTQDSGNLDDIFDF